MPKCDISVLNGLPPKPNTKTKHWNQAMFELKKYGENIEAMRDKLGGIKDKSLRMLMMKNKPGKSTGPNAVSQSDSPGRQPRDQDGGLSVANHGAPPPVVEVTPSDGTDGMGFNSDAEVSSPGTPPSLQIVLDDSSSGHNNVGASSSSSRGDKSPSKGRAMPSGGRSLIGAISRNSQVPVSLDFNSDGGGGGAQSVVVRSPSSGAAASANSKMKRKGLKAGAALSALVTSLAQRKRVAEQVGVLTPVHQGAVFRGAEAVMGGAAPGAGGGMDETEPPPGRTKPGDEAQDKSNSPFSSIYEHKKQTAFAIVDPNQKRTKRKTTKVAGNDLPPAAKKLRLNAGEDTPSSAGDSVPLGDTAAFVAKLQEYGSAAISALNNSSSGTITTTSSPSSLASTPHTVASLRANTSSVRNSMSTSPQNTSGSSTNSLGVVSAPALPGLPKARTGGKKKTTKKAADKNRGKSPRPHKGVGGKASATGAGGGGSAVQAAAAANIGTSSLAALIRAPAVPSVSQIAPTATGPSTTLGITAAAANNSIITTTTTGTTAISGNGNNTTNLANQVSHGTATSRDSPSSSASGGDIRGEIVAPGMPAEEVSDFAEGSGLLADTIRKVNASLQARINQMTGHSDDMGYKYFVEKVSLNLQ